MTAPDRAQVKVAAGFFIHDGGEFLIAVESDGFEHHLMRCRLDGTTLPGSVALGSGYYSYDRPRGDHLIAVTKDDERSRLEVRNWRTGEQCCRIGVWDDYFVSERLDWVGPPAALGEDGRAIFARGYGLVSLPGKELLRDTVKGFEVRHQGVQANAFWTEEHWGAYVGKFEMPRATTLALRSMEDGRVLVRLVPGIEPSVLAEGGRLTATYNGDIYNWPPILNHPLLALCQSILALPLILLWAVLRWRRNRRLRLACVQP